jgi:putative sigma-54 modulation protein
MQIHTTTRHCELDPEVRVHAQERLERLARYFRNPDDLMEAHVVFEREKYRHSAEVTLKLRHGEVVSREQADDPRAAIDLATAHLEQQLRRRKEKMIERRHGGGLRGLNGAAVPKRRREDTALEESSGEEDGRADPSPTEE